MNGEASSRYYISMFLLSLRITRDPLLRAMSSLIGGYWKFAL